MGEDYLITEIGGNEDHMELSRKIRLCRQQKGYSMRELAAKAEISPSYLSKLERDLISQPSLEVVRKISYALEIPLEDFLAKDAVNAERPPRVTSVPMITNSEMEALPSSLQKTLKYLLTPMGPGILLRPNKSLKEEDLHIILGLVEYVVKSKEKGEM